MLDRFKQSKFYVSAFALYASLFASFAVAQPPEIDTHEIVRRGNAVEYVRGLQAAPDAAALAALAPPADDSHKWFITVVKQPNCKPCASLLHDLNSTESLRAFVNPGDAKQSWAHFTVYSSDDETQSWRFKNIAIKAYPTLLVQPPRNGKYGDAATVVLQKTGYNGDAKQLADQLRTAIQNYVRKLQAVHAAVGTTGTRTGAAQPREAIAQQLNTSNLLSLRDTDSRIGATPSNAYDPVAWFGPESTLAHAAEQKRVAPFAPPKNEPQPKPADDILPPDPASIPNPQTVPPQVDADATKNPAKPQADDKPANDPTKPQTSPTPVYPQHPEAIVVVDKFADNITNDATWVKIRAIIQRLQHDRPGLIVRMLDLRDAGNYPIKREELLAIITTSDGQIETKLDKNMLPLVANDAPAFPWQALISLLTGGFSWVGVGALGIWAVATVRRWRAARGQQQLLDNDTAAKLREMLERLFAQMNEKK